MRRPASRKSPRLSDEATRRKIAADLDASIARGTRSTSDGSCVRQPTDDEKSLIASETRYADERLIYRKPLTGNT